MLQLCCVLSVHLLVLRVLLGARAGGYIHSSFMRVARVWCFVVVVVVVVVVVMMMISIIIIILLVIVWGPFSSFVHSFNGLFATIILLLLIIIIINRYY